MNLYVFRKHLIVYNLRTILYMATLIVSVNISVIFLYFRFYCMCVFLHFSLHKFII